MRHRLALLSLALALLLPAATAALEPPTRIEPPSPDVFIERDSISIAVLRARPDDDGFRSMLSTAWGTLGAQDPGSVSPMLGMIVAFMGPRGSEDFLHSFLPVQAVRVDRIDESGRPVPTLAYTVSGWSGLQSLVYASLTNGPRGQPYPADQHDGEVIVRREGWEDPIRAHVLTRVDGTFVSCPTPERARQVIEAMHRRRTQAPQTMMVYAYEDLNHDADTYGVVLNKNGSLLQFLEWLNAPDFGRVRADVGAERLDRIAAGVTSMAWEGDLVSDDRVDLQVRFTSESEGNAVELGRLMGQARDVLDRHGRVGHLQIATTGRETHVIFSMIGFRAALQSYLVGSGSM